MGKLVRFSIHAHCPLGLHSRNQKSPFKSFTKSIAPNLSFRALNKSYTILGYLLRQGHNLVTQMRVRSTSPIHPSFFGTLGVNCYWKYSVTNNSHSNVHCLSDVLLEYNGTNAYRLAIMLG